MADIAHGWPKGFATLAEIVSAIYDYEARRRRALNNRARLRTASLWHWEISQLAFFGIASGQPEITN
jgi:hypothetical protein